MGRKPFEREIVEKLSTKKQILFVIILTAGFLLLGELGIRTWAYYFRASYEQYNRHTGRLELIPNLHHVEKNGHEFRTNSRGFVGAEFDDVPVADTKRIIAIGDSCTFTLGLWEIAYPAVVEQKLNRSAVQGQYEYINAGVEGYNSSFALARIKDDVLRYKPRIVTIYIGWNDLMKQNPESQAEVGKPSLVGEVLNESYLVKAYTKVIFIYLRPLLFIPKVEPDETDLHAYDQYVPKRFEANIREMINELKRNDVEAILFTLPTVLERGLTAEDLKKRGVFFPYYAGFFSLDRLLSLHAAYNRTIRTVAQQEGVPLIDLDEKFNGLDRRKLFWDTMHPSEKGNAVIADLVSERILSLQIGKESSR